MNNAITSSPSTGGATDLAGTGAGSDRKADAATEEGLAGVHKLLWQSCGPNAAMLDALRTASRLDLALLRRRAKPYSNNVCAVRGVRYKPEGAQILLSLRALVLTETRWEQFWQKISQYGVPNSPQRQ